MYATKGKNNFFEGWYFKTQQNGHIFSFIVGVSRAHSKPHAFVQYIDDGTAHYFEFPIEMFSFDKKGMTITVGENRFSLKGIECNLADKDFAVKASLKFGVKHLFNKTAYCPSIMGPFAYLPLSCNHVVVSMSHKVNGSIKAGAKPARKIDNALGYIEKDFGKKFPKNYYWTQGQEDGISVMFALAYPLVFGIKGFLCLVQMGGKQYNFSLYAGTKFEVIKLTGERAELILRKGKKAKLHLIVTGDSADAKSLKAPGDKGSMMRKINENVRGKMKGELTLQNGTEFEFEMPCAFEYNILG